MAVKAKAEITISWIIDIDSVTRYYLLQSSTASAPPKPTANPPGGKWVTTEPSYTSGATNTLYFVDLTVMTDSSFSYSAVSKSSSYEAAKEAWNKANSKPDMDDIGNYVASRGENLVTNGTCLLGNNTNFSQFVFDGSDTYYAGGSFKLSSKNKMINSDEFIPVDTANKYALSYYIKTDNSAATYYDMLVMYDIDKRTIESKNVMWIDGSTTKLAKELKNGDTVVYLEDVSGFNTTTAKSYQRGLIFWNYTNSKGYTYGTETYSRNRWETLWDDGSAINKTNNTITLKTAWSHGTFPTGTDVSQCSDGATYTYLNANYKLPVDTWVQKKGYVNGIGRRNESGKFREGTAFIKVGWYLPYQASVVTVTKLSTISLTQNTSIKDIETQLEVTANNILTKVKGSYATQEGLKEIKTEADQTANKFNWLVQSGDSATNFQLTDRVASLVADNINLKGLVTVLGAVTAGSFNLGSGKFKVSASGILEATDAKIAGEITASSGTIGSWVINESGLGTLDKDIYTDDNGNRKGYLTSRLEKDYLKIGYIDLDDQNKRQAYSLIESGILTMYSPNASTVSINTREAEALFNGFCLTVTRGDDTVELNGDDGSSSFSNSIKVGKKGLFIKNNANSYIRAINYSDADNLVIGYGLYETSAGNTNIYGGTGIKFQLKSPDTAWYPYYKKGDSFNVVWHGAGYITNAGKEIHFSIPLSKPPIGVSGVTVASVDGFTVRQDNKYLYGSSASANAKPSSYVANIDAGSNSVHIKATMPNTTNVTNNSVCGLYVSIKVTFN